MPEQAKKKTVPETEQQAALPKTTLQQVVPSVVRAVDFKTYYTNFVNTGITPFDISLLIGETLGVDQQGNLLVEQTAKITMSPLEAKMVLHLLVAAIVQYEGQFGKIFVPPGIGLPTDMIEPKDKTEGV